MNRRILSILAIGFITICSAFSIAQTSGQTPPDINGAWTIFSLPCTVDLSEGSESSALVGTIYSWNGDKYVKTTSIERGVGYITDSKNSGHVKQLCSGKINSDEKLITYKQGWNLAGNPYRKAVNFTEMPGAPLKLPRFQLYELRGKSFVSITNNPVITPWQGYWLYIEKDISISLAKDCRIDIFAYSDAGRTSELTWPVLSSMEKIYLSAVEICSGEDNFISRMEKNDKASWSISGVNQGAISKNGVFTPFETGTSEITVSVENFNSQRKEIVVSSRCEAVLAAYSDNNETNEIESGTTYSDYSPAYFRALNRCFSGDESFVDTRVTSDIQWSVSPNQDIEPDPETGALIVDKNGEYVVQAYFDEKSTKEFTINYAAPLCALRLQAFDSYEMTLPLGEEIFNDGKTLFLSLNKTCVLNNKVVSSEPLSNISSWNLDKPALADIDGAAKTLNPRNSGELLLSATADGLTSNLLKISISMPSCSIVISKHLDSERNVPMEASVVGKEQKVYLSAEKICKTAAGDNLTSDITMNSIWFMGPNGYGTLTGPDKSLSGPIFTPSMSGLAYFWIKENDIESAKVGLKIRIPACSIRAVAYKDSAKTLRISESDSIVTPGIVYLEGQEICSVPDEPDQITNITGDGSWTVKHAGSDISVKDDSFTINNAGSYEVTFLKTGSTSKTISITATSHICERRIEMYRTTSPATPVSSPVTTYGEPISFKAFETCYSNGSQISETDITDTAKWRASVNKYGEFNKDSHTYTPSKSGSVGIYASINNADIGKSVVIAIFKACSLEVRAFADKDRKNRLAPPFKTGEDPIYISPIEVCVSNTTKTETIVTEEIQWRVSDTDRLYFDSNDLFILPKGGSSGEIWFVRDETPSSKMRVTSTIGTCSIEITAYSDSRKTNILTSPVVNKSQNVFLTAIETCMVDEEFIKSSDVTKKLKCSSNIPENASQIDRETGEFIPQGVGYGESACGIDDVSKTIQISLIEFIRFNKYSNFNTFYWLATTPVENTNVYGFYRLPCKDKSNSCNNQLRYQDITQWVDIYVNNIRKDEKGIIDTRNCIGYGGCFVTLSLNEALKYRFYIIPPLNDTISEAPLEIKITSEHYLSNQIIQAVPTWRETWMNSPLPVFNNYSWEIGDTDIVEFKDGLLVTKKPGVTWIRATFSKLRTEKKWVFVFGDGQWEQLEIYSGSNQAVRIGKFRTYYKYLHRINQSRINPVCLNATDIIVDDCLKDAYTYKKVYDLIDIKSSTSLFKTSANSFTSMTPGLIDFWGEYNGLKSNVLTVDFWDEKEMHYCKGATNNKSEWEDPYWFGSHATLETSCHEYSYGDTVYVQYVAEIPYYSWYQDHCLDLYIVDTDYNVVKTLREEVCGNEPLNKGRSSSRTSYMEKIYESMEEWDMKDDAGKLVPTGKYYAIARFYITYEPVIEVPFVIKPASSPEDEAANNSF